MWTLAEALALVRKLQPEARKLNYHITLGGGVLNNGGSDKDLDLYFLPLEDESNHPDDKYTHNVFEVMGLLHKITGALGWEINEDYAHLRSSYKIKKRYIFQSGQVVEIFVV